MVLSQAVRRLRGPRSRCRRSPSAASAVLRSGRDGRLLARAGRLPHLRPWRRHHPDARPISASSPRTPPPRRSPTSPPLSRAGGRTAASIDGARRVVDAGDRRARRRPGVGDAEIIPIGTRGRRAVAPATRAVRGRTQPRRPAPKTTARPSGPASRRRSRPPRAEAGADDPRRPGRQRPSRRRAPPPPRDRARWPASRRRLARARSRCGPRGLRRRLGAALAHSWPSCAAGSPATTPSTSTASTRRSPSGSLAALRPIAAEVVPDRGPRHREHPRRRRRAGRLQPLRHDPGRRR